MNRSSIRVASYLVGASAIATLVVLSALGKVSAYQLRAAAPIRADDAHTSVPDGDVLRWLSLGHHEAVADLVWLDALSYYGARFTRRNQIGWLDRHIDAITTVDPRFRLVFEWAGTVIMYGGEINNESVLASNRYLEQGIERFPDDWLLHFMLGINYAFELQPTNDEQRAEWRGRGVEYLVKAGSLPGAPPTVRLAAASMRRKTSSWYESKETLEEFYLSRQDPAGARSIRRQIEAMFPHDEAEALLGRRRAIRHLERHPRWRIVSEDAALVVHPDPVFLFEPPALRPLSPGRTR